MKTAIMLVSCCVVGLAATGCAVTPDLAPPADAGGKQWVAVSAMGNRARLQHIGTTVFNNVVTHVDASGWRLDGHIESLVERQRPALQWVRTEIPHEVREGFSRIGLDGLSRMADSGRRKASMDALRNACACEFAVIVSPAQWGDDISNTSASLTGYGVHQRGFIGAPDYARAFVSLQVTLVDLRKGEETGSYRTSRIDSLPFRLSKERKLIPEPAEFSHIENAIKSMIEPVLNYGMGTLPQR